MDIIALNEESNESIELLEEEEKTVEQEKTGKRLRSENYTSKKNNKKKPRFELFQIVGRLIKPEKEVDEQVEDHDKETTKSKKSEATLSAADANLFRKWYAKRRVYMDEDILKEKIKTENLKYKGKVPSDTTIYRVEREIKGREKRNNHAAKDEKEKKLEFKHLCENTDCKLMVCEELSVKDYGPDEEKYIGSIANKLDCGHYLHQVCLNKLKLRSKVCCPKCSETTIVDFTVSAARTEKNGFAIQLSFGEPDKQQHVWKNWEDCGLREMEAFGAFMKKQAQSKGDYLVIYQDGAHCPQEATP